MPTDGAEGMGIFCYIKILIKSTAQIFSVSFFLHLLILHFVFFCNLCSYISMSFLECKHPHILNDRFFSFLHFMSFEEVLRVS